MTYFVAYLAAAAAFLLIDLVWLGRVAKQFYRDRLGSLLRERFAAVPAALFYSVYVIGIVVFAIAPSLPDGSLLHAASLGALFGFFAYGTYDMTNFITLKGWPLTVTVVDIAWGTFLSGTSAAIGFAAARAIG